MWIDLLNDHDFIRYQRDPGLLYREAIQIAGTLPSDKLPCYPHWIVIDEVQRVPQLLNEVHRVIQDSGPDSPVRFALTGSSARKLRRGGANLLGGRALVYHLYPLTYFELGDDFNLTAVLNWGSLPHVASQNDEEIRSELLDSYYATYLREEIREEQVVRQLDPFTRFLETAAQSSGQVINYAAIARDCRVDERNVARYYQILEDTLLGLFLPGFNRSIRKQQTVSPKFYLFDLGVQRALIGSINTHLSQQSYGFGRAFEQFIILEIHRLNSYLRRRYKLSYLRTKDGVEVDLVIERAPGTYLLIEIKSSATTNLHDAKHLRSLAKDLPGSECWVVSQDLHERDEDGVSFLPWQRALERLGGDGFKSEVLHGSE